MVLWLSKRPGDVRDTWCVLQKARWCEGHLMRSPEDSGCEGPADTLLILITNAHDYLSLIIATSSYTLLHYITIYHWLLLSQAIHYYFTSLLIIDYYYTELCTTTLHYYLSLIIFTLSHVLVHNDKDNNTCRSLTDICNWPLLYPLPKSILQKTSTSIYRASKERDILR